MDLKDPPLLAPKFDIHIHLAGTGCHGSGCSMHPKLSKRYTIKLLQLLHRISRDELENNFDEPWLERVSALVKESPVDYGVVLGFDAATDAFGELDSDKTQLIVPPAWVFAACRRYPNLLPGPSINPHRKDARARLEECIENKAVLIKWLPSAQCINPSHPSLKPFYAILAQHGIPLLIHCGGERTFASYEPRYNRVEHLQAPLDAGVKVICAHSGTKVFASGDEDQQPLLTSFLQRYPGLWLDNSGLCNPSRFMHVPRLAADPLVCGRTLYGSDWPVPASAWYFLRQMGLRKVREFESEKNWISRDIAIKEFFGFPRETLTRASGVLANLDYWVNVHSSS